MVLAHNEPLEVLKVACLHNSILHVRSQYTDAVLRHPENALDATTVLGLVSLENSGSDRNDV